MSKRKRSRHFLRIREYGLRGGKGAAKIIAVTSLSTATSEGTRRAIKKLEARTRRRRE